MIATLVRPPIFCYLLKEIYDLNLLRMAMTNRQVSRTKYCHLFSLPKIHHVKIIKMYFKSPKERNIGKPSIPDDDNSMLLPHFSMHSSTPILLYTRKSFVIEAAEQSDAILMDSSNCK